MMFRIPAARRYRIAAWLLIVFAAAWTLADAGAAIWQLNSPIGTWHIRADYDGVVHSRGSCADFGPSAEEPKRTIDLQHTDRTAVVRILLGVARPAERVTVQYLESAGPQTLVASPDTLCHPRDVTIMLRSLGAIAMVVLGAVLLLRLPSLPILGFFLFLVGFSPMSQAALNAFLPADGAIAQNLLNDVFEGAGLWGITLFCEGLGARNAAMRRFVALVAVVATICSVMADVRIEVWRQPSAMLFMISQALVAVGALLTIALLAVTYFGSDQKIRARLRWINVSFAIGIPLYMIGYVSDNVPFIPIPLSESAVDLLYLAIILIPAAVTYAVLRNHVMDAGLFVGRGTMYAVFIAITIALLEGLIALARPLVETVPVLTVVAALFVVSFHPITQWGEKKFAEWFDKDRAHGLRHLRRSARKFALVDSFRDLEKIIVQSAASSLRLAGAALVSKQRVIEATPSYAAHAADLELLARDGRLREELEASDGAVRLNRNRYPGPLNNFHDDVLPLVAIALEDPGLPFHVFVVGPHLNGTDLDKEEIRALELFVERGLIAHLVMATRDIERRIGMPSSPLSE